MLADSQITKLIFAGTAFFLAQALLLIYVIMRSSGQKNFHFWEKQRLIDEIKTEKIKEGERVMNEISREIHDNFGQIVSSICASLTMIKALPRNPEERRIITDIDLMANMLLVKTHNLAYALNGEHIKAIGLNKSIENQLDFIKKYKAIDYEFYISGHKRKLRPENQQLVYRIAQEALQNITKHSAATLITLTLDYGDKDFKMTIKDDGVGMASNLLHAKKGIGLNNMRERAEVLNGSIRIESNTGIGFTVTLLIPGIQYA